jgi:RecB family endonuclease NucS
VAMMALIRHMLRPSHDQIVSAVENTLLEQHWKVDREPIVGTVRPDLVARQPDGTVYVFEIKQGGLEANLGAVAQVETYRNAVAKQYGGQARGVLVVAGEASQGLDEIAGRADVEIVRTSADALSIGESLTRSGVLEGSAAAQAPMRLDVSG